MVVDVVVVGVGVVGLEEVVDVVEAVVDVVVDVVVVGVGVVGYRCGLYCQIF